MTASEPSSADLWRTYSYVSLRCLHASSTGRAFLIPGGVLTLGGVPVPDVNWAYVYGPDDPVAATRDLVGRLRELDLPGHLVTPMEFGDVAAEAERLGLVPCEGAPLMLTDEGADGRSGEDDSFRVAPVTDEATFSDALETLAAAFSDDHGYVRQLYRPLLLRIPGVHMFAAHDGDVLASFCESVEVGGVAWFTDVGSRPDRRGRGAAGSLLRGAMAWWRERGIGRFGLVADPDAQRLYESLGFRVAAESRLWLVETLGP